VPSNAAAAAAIIQFTQVRGFTTPLIHSQPRYLIGLALLLLIVMASYAWACLFQPDQELVCVTVD
jgi:hypothetical protein